MRLEEEFDAHRAKVENDPYWVAEKVIMPTENEWQRAKEYWLHLRRLGMWQTYPFPDSGVVMDWIRGDYHLGIWVGDDEEGDLLTFSGPSVHSWRRIEWSEVVEIATEWGEWYLKKTAGSNEPS